MKMFINSQWVSAHDTIDVTDPFNNSLIDTVPKATSQDALDAIAAAENGLNHARKMTSYQRAEVLYKTAEIIRDESDDFAQLIAREGSKTIREARKEVRRCINTITVSAEEAKRITGETIPFDSFPGGEQRTGYYYRCPVGIVLAIIPFNDPLNLTAHKLGPALAGGNSLILKPATYTPLSAIKLTETLLRAGMPPEILQLVTGPGGEVGETMVKDDRIRMISFTGGLEAGKRITQVAGLKKLSMELGSNSPVIVWDDCDLDWAVESCISGAFWAAGQNCIGVQRLYVHKKLYEKFREGFVVGTKKYKSGNKLLEETDMGPMITETEAARVEQWVEEARKAGAEILTGGTRSGSVMEPTVMENVPVNAKVHKDEVFGPTVNLYPVEDFDDAVEKANSLPFGLHAAVFTGSLKLAQKASAEIECGTVLINDSTDYRLDSMPFGGMKNSGLGREGIKSALLEMTEPKVVCYFNG